MAEHPQEEEGLPGLLSDDSYFFSSDEHEEFDSEPVDPADEPDGSAPGPEPGAQNRICPQSRHDLSELSSPSVSFDLLSCICR